MSRKGYSEEEKRAIRENATPTGVTCQRGKRTVTEFLCDEFEDIVLDPLRPHTGYLEHDNLQEAGITLWYDPEIQEWVSTEVYSIGDAHLPRIERPYGTKNEIIVHTHEALSLGLSPSDVLQLVPFTDDPPNIVGPMEGMVAMSRDFGRYLLYGYQRTLDGREVDCVETIQGIVNEATEICTNTEEPEWARKRILELYGDAVEQCDMTWVPS